MRFRIQIDVWVDVGTVDGAESAVQDLHCATLQAMAGKTATDPTTGAVLRSELVPSDDLARRALRAADLGPGVSAAVWPTDHNTPAD